MIPNKNIDSTTVAGFGDEWTRFDQSELSENESRELFDNYFSLFPWEVLTEDAQGFDLGCGSGCNSSAGFEHGFLLFIRCATSYSRY